MSVLLVYIVALAMALIFRKKIYETIIGSVILESLILFVSNFCIRDLRPGVYLIFALTLAGAAICIYYAFADFERFKEELLSPASLAWYIFVIFFALTNVGRGLSDYDDYIVWGLEVKNMYINNAIYSPVSTSQGYYPPATMCWNYLACKTWPFGYTDSAILWSYDTYIMACLLPLFRYVTRKSDIYKRIIIVIMCLLMPVSLVSWSYSTVYSRLCADVLLGVLVYYSLYVVHEYVKNKDVFYFVQLLSVLYAITLTKRIGITWTVFPLIMLLYFSLDKDVSNRGRKRNTRDLILISVSLLFPMVVYYMWDGLSINIFVPLVSMLPAILLVLVKRLTGKSRKILVASSISICALAVLVTPRVAPIISSFENDTKNITVYFFNSLFSNEFAGFGVLLKLPLFTFCTLAVLLFLYLLHTYKENEDILAGYRKLIVILAGIVVNVAILYMAYLTAIGLDPNWNGLPAYERYTSPYYMLILLIVLETVLEMSKEQLKPLLVYLVVFVIQFVNLGNFTNFIFDKNPQLEYPGLDNSGVVLNASDKVYYVNHQEGRWYNAPFYYYICPAISNTEGIIGYDKSTDSVSLTAEQFSEELIDGEYNYLYIKNLYPAFIHSYSSLFNNPEDIHDNSFYRIDIKDGKVRLSQL